MVNATLVEERKVRLQMIRKYLFETCQTGIDARRLSESEFGKKLGIDQQIAKKDLIQLEKQNLVTAKAFGNTDVYYPNGKAIGGENPHAIPITSDQTLYLDVFPGPFDKPFIRLAQKRGEQLVGSVIVPEDKIKDFMGKFEEQVKQLRKLKT